MNYDLDTAEDEFGERIAAEVAVYQAR